MHRLLNTVVMIAARFVDDAWYSNVYYARVGGVGSVPEMNKLELKMFNLINFIHQLHLPTWKTEQNIFLNRETFRPMKLHYEFQLYKASNSRMPSSSSCTSRKPLYIVVCVLLFQPSSASPTTCNDELPLMDKIEVAVWILGLLFAAVAAVSSSIQAYAAWRPPTPEFHRRQPVDIFNVS